MDTAVETAMNRGERSVLLFGRGGSAVPRVGTAELTDENLLERIAAGDRDAFCALYDAYRGMVFGFALSMLRNTHDAEDAVQDTFLRVREAAHLYTPRGKAKAWLLTIARNVCLMQLRGRSRSASLPDEDQIVDLSSVSDRDDRMALEAAFSVLSDEECRIVVLHAVSGLKHREIAQLLERPLSTVLSKYSRGIAKLRRELEESL